MTTQEKRKDSFWKEYQKLCDKYNMNITSFPEFVMDEITGKYSIVLKFSVAERKK